MPNEISAPILSYDDIRRRADDFLATYHPSRKPPVPIEEIIEFRLRINIVPVAGLRRAFDIDAFTSCDCTEITVDQLVYNRYENRYRFDLAHEVGHIDLHRSVFSGASFHNVTEWMSFIKSLSDEQHSWFEYQAYCFGGLVLVPSDQLERETVEVLRKALDAGIDIRPSNTAAWEYMAEYLRSRFLVSPQVILKRLRYEEIRTGHWLKSRHFL